MILGPFQQYFSHIRSTGDNERLCAMGPRLQLKISPRPELEPGTARSVGKRLTY